MGDVAGIEEAAATEAGVDTAGLLSNSAEVDSVTRPARPRLATWTAPTDGVPTSAGFAPLGEVEDEIGTKAGVVALEIAGAARPAGTRAARSAGTGAARPANTGTGVLEGTGVAARATIGTAVLAMAGDARPGKRRPTAVGKASRFLLTGTQGMACPATVQSTPVGRARGPVDIGGPARYAPRSPIHCWSGPARGTNLETLGVPIDETTGCAGRDGGSIVGRWNNDWPFVVACGPERLLAAVLDAPGKARAPEEPTYNLDRVSALPTVPVSPTVPARTASGSRWSPVGGPGAKFARCPDRVTTAAREEPTGCRRTIETGMIGGRAREPRTGPDEVIAVWSQDGSRKRDRMAPASLSS
jgi:hypothetical protein